MKDYKGNEYSIEIFEHESAEKLKEDVDAYLIDLAPHGWEPLSVNYQVYIKNGMLIYSAMVFSR